MKKIAIIVAAVLAVTGIGAAAYFGTQYYKAKNDPVAKILKGAFELRVSESTKNTEIKYKDVPDSFIKRELEKQVESGESDENEIILYNLAIKTLADKLNYSTYSKVVLDDSRKDFGFASNYSINYGDEGIIDFEFSSDFEDIYMYVPKLLSKKFVLSIPDTLSNLDEDNKAKIDLKEYIKIILEDDVPKQTMITYYDILKEFLNEERFEKLEKQEVLLADGNKISTEAYKIKISKKDFGELIKISLDKLSKDEKTLEYIENKVDSLFNKYIESKDYKATGASLEEVEESRKNIKQSIADLKENKFDMKKIDKIISSGKESLSVGQKEISELEYINEIVINLDKEGKIRRIKTVSDNEMISISSETIINKIGKEVEEKVLFDASEAVRIDSSLNTEVLMQEYALEVIDNASLNILSSKAAEDMVSDIVKAIKLSDDIDDETKEEAVEEASGIIEGMKQTLSFVKMMFGAQGN